MWCETAYSDIEQTLFALHDQLDFEAAARLAHRTGDAAVYLKDLTAKHDQNDHPGDGHPFAASVRAFRAESAHLTLRVIALTQWLAENWDAQARQPTQAGRFDLDPYLRLLLVQHRQQYADSPDHIEAAQRALTAEARVLVTESHRLAAWAQVTACWMESHATRLTRWPLTADDEHVPESAA